MSTSEPLELLPAGLLGLGENVPWSHGPGCARSWWRREVVSDRSIEGFASLGPALASRCSLSTGAKSSSEAPSLDREEDDKVWLFRRALGVVGAWSLAGRELVRGGGDGRGDIAAFHANMTLIRYDVLSVCTCIYLHHIRLADRRIEKVTIEERTNQSSALCVDRQEC